jgi:uncharacterized membrane protein
MAPVLAHYNGGLKRPLATKVQAMRVALWLHLCGIVVWIGGMFFAQMALRPSVGALPPPQRLSLLAAVMTRFLGWAALAIVLVFGSGAMLLAAGGGALADAPAVRAMAGIAVIMAVIYVYIVARPLRGLRRAVAAADWPAGAAAMGTIRLLVLVNLVLGGVALTAAVLLAPLR